MAARKGRRLVRVRLRAAARSAVKFLAGGGRRRWRRGGGGGTEPRPCAPARDPACCGGGRRGARPPGGAVRAGRATRRRLRRSQHQEPRRPRRRRWDSLPGERGRMTELQSALLLRRQLAELNKNPVEGFSAGLIDDNDLYRWEVLIIGPPDTLYEGGVFKAHLTFPKDYPLRPPKMKFITEIWHPNVDKNGDVCISILHEPGEDKYGYEKPEERWLPIHTVETIMISVISMLADPNGDSPANVDAAKEWREDRNGEFKRKVARCVRKSQETAFE
ncbi:LOW QUALITY PROTEIN: ubiquitin-conjugating enzyme E2 G1 [Chlamydotis macqueenii]